MNTDDHSAGRLLKAPEPYFGRDDLLVRFHPGKFDNYAAAK
jgi:hypothetical protein